MKRSPLNKVQTQSFENFQRSRLDGMRAPKLIEPHQAIKHDLNLQPRTIPAEELERADRYQGTISRSNLSESYETSKYCSDLPVIMRQQTSNLLCRLGQDDDKSTAYSESDSKPDHGTKVDIHQADGKTTSVFSGIKEGDADDLLPHIVHRRSHGSHSQPRKAAIQSNQHRDLLRSMKRVTIKEQDTPVAESERQSIKVEADTASASMFNEDSLSYFHKADRQPPSKAENVSTSYENSEDQHSINLADIKPTLRTRTSGAGGRSRRSTYPPQSSLQSSRSISNNQSLMKNKKAIQHSLLRPNSDESESDDEDGDQPASNASKTIDHEDKKLFACPFFKHRPIKYSGSNSTLGEHKYRRCSTSCLRNISRIKQHIQRVHCLPQHLCKRCLEEFSCDDALEAHQQNDEPCNRRSAPCDERIGTDKYDKIKRTSNSNQYALWYEIYDVLFPGDSKPESPYIEDDGFEIAKSMAMFFEWFCPENIKSMITAKEHETPLPEDISHMVHRALMMLPSPRQSFDIATAPEMELDSVQIREYPCQTLDNATSSRTFQLRRLAEIAHTGSDSTSETSSNSSFVPLFCIEGSNTVHPAQLKLSIDSPHVSSDIGNEPIRMNHDYKDDFDFEFEFNDFVQIPITQ